jgi:hypothetical protein
MDNLSRDNTMSMTPSKTGFKSRRFGTALRVRGTSASSSNDRGREGGGSLSYHSSAGGGGKDPVSFTQFALIDDVSAQQQITKGGNAAITMASAWKSHFDDSEETDNELKDVPGNVDILSPEGGGGGGGSGSGKADGQDWGEQGRSVVDEVSTIDYRCDNIGVFGCPPTIVKFQPQLLKT